MADALSRRLRSTLWASGAVLLIGSVGATCGIGVRKVEEVPPVAGGARGVEEVERAGSATLPPALRAAQAPDGLSAAPRHGEVRAAVVTTGSAAEAPR